MNFTNDFFAMGENIVCQALAGGGAEQIRSNGGTTATGVDLNPEADDPNFRIDVELVRHLAEQVLAR
ncbi:hypothetical protein [Herbiconiux daphne]|uniref:Uncharacterized protein n=1 Tax=Herbiconiux daphne TaxID=2970914 RepID=A0ABT2H0A3_9MICO|nr:hypothetical protein [Herbiconiux daphne]MCS5732866.1 hypothetical protein [Herbiconiux daphne]